MVARIVPIMPQESQQMARQAHKPTKANKSLVQLHATLGTPQANIANIMGINVQTLRKYYRHELDYGGTIATAAVAGTLWKKAVGGDTTAAIFWMKTRGGWSEKKAVDHTSSDGTMTPAAAPAVAIDVTQLSTQALQELIAAVEMAQNAAKS